MKSFELKISLIQKKKRIMRTLLVSKKTTYEQLHEMIQLLFNLDCTYRDGAFYLVEAGNLAGSALYMNQGLKNFGHANAVGGGA